VASGRPVTHALGSKLAFGYEERMNGVRLSGAALVVGSMLWTACAPPPPPPAPPAPDPLSPAAPKPLRMSTEPLNLGKPCATGESTCGGGVCDLKVKNDCDAPITCDVVVASSCTTAAGVAEVTGRKRTTFAAKEEGKLNIGALCPEGNVVRTAVTDLKCK